MAPSAIFDFDSPDFDWQAYLRYRPQYPQSLYETIYGFHASHADTWSLACDMGAGIGNVTVALTERFATVECSDASSTYVDRAREYVSSIPFAKDKVIFAVRRAEEPVEDDKAGKVDMMTMAMAIHWTDPSAVIAAAAHALRPGGTLAIWVYGASVFAGAAPSERCRKLLADVYMKWRPGSGMPLGHKPFVQIIGSRLDVLDFSSEEWGDVRRVHWSAGQSTVGFELAHTDWETKVGAKDVVEPRESEHLMSVDADMEWIRGFYRSLYPGIDSDELCREEFSRLEKELEGRKMTLCWPVSLVLAARK